MTKADLVEEVIRVAELSKKDAEIVVYCAGYGCEASHLVARALRAKGFAAKILDV